LLVIDGNSLAHRAFHAIPLLSTTWGVITNAVYGFTNMLLKVLAEYPAELVAVCFDKGKITFRHGDYEGYKAHRKATPDELRTQFPLIKELLAAMRIPVLEREGYEADDLIGTLTFQAEKAKIKSIILTGDQDALQLVSPLTRVLLTRKGITELEEYTEEKVAERFGVAPSQFADYKGLVGDHSDNIPGVPGIGAKTAAALLKEYGSLENLIALIPELPDRLQEKIGAYANQALLSKRLATILRDAPLEVDLQQCRWTGPDHQQMLTLFHKLEFKSLLRSLEKNRAEAGDKEKRKGGRKVKEATLFSPGDGAVYLADHTTVNTPEKYAELLSAAKRAGRLALAVEGNREKGVTGTALALAGGPEGGGRVYLLPPGDASAAVLKEICADENIEKIIHNGKNALWLLRASGITLLNLHFDPMVAAYLTNPGTPNLDLQDLALEHLGMVLPPGNGPEALPARAEAVCRLESILKTKLALLEMEKLFYAVEMPLVSVLAEMEMAGVAVDTKRLSLIAEELGERIRELSAEIYRLAGEEFNINSTRQLSQILFEKLRLPVIKRTKTGYSTDVEVLEELAGLHPVIGKILEHRQLTKLKTTYADGLAALVNPLTGRLHTTFHQTVTATGRLSSSEPNLQNIPIRLEEGRKIRQVFVPCQKTNLILTADYSQIELRILAHVTEDPSLIESFTRGEDIHTRTAAEIFGVPAEAVTREMRTKAKAVNFGIVYGLSDYGLARDIGVSRQEAKQYIENYFLRYREVRKYIEKIKAEAREKGYVTTILNRRRYLPDLFSPNRTLRSFGERAAVNTPIQGSAADIIKLAMIRAHNEIKKCGLETKMILQVHDELIFDVPAKELKEAALLVKNCMENAVSLKVPLVVEVKAGPNWYETKPIQF